MSDRPFTLVCETSYVLGGSQGAAFRPSGRARGYGERKSHVFTTRPPAAHTHPAEGGLIGNLPLDWL